MADEQRERNILGYSSPETERRSKPRKPPVDGYCVAALLVALVSPIHAVVAGGAVGLGVYGALRASESKRRVRGQYLGLTAILMALFWPVFAPQFGRPRAREIALMVQCAANMRTIGQDIAMYESKYPGANGYGIDDLAKGLGWSTYSYARCPLDHAVDANGTPLTGYSYVLLPNLQPYASVQDRPNTVIAFDMHTHSWDENGAKDTAVVLLFADGHVEHRKPMDAQSAIMRSLMLQPATLPATTQPASSDASSRSEATIAQ